MDDFMMPEELDCMDDDDDDEINTMGIAESTEKVSTIDGGICSNAANTDGYMEQMKQLVEQYKQIKQETKEINELARQLAIGVHLQKEMDKCSSQRGDFVVQIRLELKFLGSGSSLLLVTLQNKSDFVLHNWHLVVTIILLSTSSPIGCDALKSYSKSLRVERLGKEQEFLCELLCTERLLVPLLLRPQLLKRFPLLDDVSVFRLELETIYFSLWDLISKVPDLSYLSSQSSVMRAVIYRRSSEEQKLTLPEALVFLLCNENASENGLLKWVLPCVDESSVNCFECILRENPTKVHRIRVEIKKVETNYEIVVTMKDATLRMELITQLQLRILVKMRYIYRELEGKCECEEVIDSSSISKYFNSFISRFIP